MRKYNWFERLSLQKFPGATDYILLKKKKITDLYFYISYVIILSFSGENSIMQGEIIMPSVKD